MNTLVVFDFDYTLAKTSENIWVWSPRGTRSYNNNLYNPIHPTEIQKTKIADDELINDESFLEFHDINLEKAKIIYPIFLYLTLFSQNSKYKILILSARPQCVENKIYQLLEYNDIDKTSIEFKGLKNSDPKEKIIYLNNYILNNNINKIIIFEDNNKVLMEAKNNLNNIKVYLFLVSIFNNEINVKFYE